MIRVDSPYRVLHPSHHRIEYDARFLQRLVQDVVTCNPGVVLVVLSKMFPENDSTVLEVFVYPEESLIGGVVTVPVCTLAAGECVQINNGVDAMTSALRSVSRYRRGPTISIARSRCFSPSRLKTLGFMSSSK